MEQNIRPNVLWRDTQPGDDVAGAQSRIVYQVLQEDGQWDEYMPTDGESQVSLYNETSSCTNNSCSNSIDAQVNRMIKLGLIPKEKLDKLIKYKFVVDGKCNTSESWNAVKSFTNPDLGNYLYKPWDSARNDGMIPEALRPFGRYTKLAEFYNPDFSAECYEAAEVWKEIFVIQYEVIPIDRASRQYHRKQAPLSQITGVCPGWSLQDVVATCSLDSGHATLDYGDKPEEYIKCFDSYQPNCKKLAWDYKVRYQIKGVVLLREALSKLSFFFNNELKFGAENPIEDVKALQIGLFLEECLYDPEWPTRELIQKFGGYFGENTREAVKKFQKKYGIPQTGVVGPITIAKLNSLFDN